jgi:glycosyltransferase involved in cell wall biosynthesis
MARKKLLIATPNCWTSPFQVGSHNLARGFARAGWEVAFISDPLSPLHLCRGANADFRRRFGLYHHGGIEDLEGRLWAYVPFALLTPHNKPLLRSIVVNERWHHWTFPGVVSTACRRGFAKVDLLYIDSVHQSFWLDAIEYEHAVFRVADYTPHFEKYTPAVRQREQAMARRVDLVLYPSQALKGYVDELGARRSLLLPNGVDFEHFKTPAPPPPEYRALPRPIAVYVGVIPSWFNFGWVRAAAEAMPHVSFVLIGPEGLARQRLGDVPNVHILGLRDYERVPGFLQHADVGIAPFDREENPRGVAVLNPQKLYAYFTAGLPVVCSDWDEVRRLNSPAHVCATADEFVAGLRTALAERGDPACYRDFAASFDWNTCVQHLLDALDGIKAESTAA